MFFRLSFRSVQCVLSATFLLCAIATGGELMVSDLELRPDEPLFWPLDRWGDWLRGADALTLDRALVTDDATGGHAVLTTARVAEGAPNKGWYFTGLRVDGAEWEGLREIRFRAKATHPGACRLRLLHSDDPWKGKQLVATQTLDLGTEWREYRLPFAGMKRAADAPEEGSPTRIRAIAWVIEGTPNDLWLDDVRVELPDQQLARVRRERRAKRLRVVERQMRILRGRAVPIALESSLPDLRNRIVENESEVALRAAERTVRAAYTLCGLRNRVRHYDDQIRGFSRANLPMGTRLMGKTVDLLERVLAAARELAVSDTMPQAIARAGELRTETDALWEELQPVFEDVVSLLRPRRVKDAWMRPSGRRIVPFAPHSMRTMFLSERGWRGPREGDYERFAEWGFNGTRLEVKYHLLEPEEGVFDPDYLALLHNVVSWCDKYGLYVIVDLHWPYPDWFYEGTDAHRNPHREEQNPYQNPEALVETHRRLARELARHPNILAWEAPTNEPAISSIEIWKREGNDPTIADIPLLMRDWNQWLRKTYGTREALDAAWRTTDQQPDANGLHEKETWARDSILPPGHFGVPAAQCTRVYDYMRWAIEYHTALTGRIAEAVHEEIPDLIIQQQPMAGGAQWERDAVPVDFGVWLQAHADGVQVGTHYGVGNSGAYLSPLDMPTVNSEEQATGRQGIYARHRARNQGACPFTYFPIKYGFCDWRGNLRESAAWMTSVADFWDSAHRVREARVLVVVNSRTEAIGGAPSGAEVRHLLERMDVEYDMVASQYVAAHPEMVGRYLCATMTLTYGDFECLRVLREADIPVFLFGSLGVDVRGRRGAGDLADQCAAASVLVKRRPDKWGEAGTSGNRVSLTQLYGPGSLGVSFDVPVHGGLTHLADSDLADGVVVLATHDVDQSPALVVQDKLLWWLGGDTLQAGPEQSERLLADFLARGGVARVWPPTPQSIYLQTHWYVTGQVVVYSEASETLDARLKTQMILLDMEGNPVSQRVGKDGSSTVPVPVPWASNARFFKLLPVHIVPKGAYEDVHAGRAVQLVGENEFSMELSGEGCRIEILAPGNAGAKATVLLDGKRHPSRFVRFRKHVMNIPTGDHSLTIRVPAGPGKPRHP